jgi:hypothetical protein
MVLLAAATGTAWTFYTFDLINIGWGQPLMLTIILAVYIWAYAMIQLSSDDHAAILKARLERESAELAEIYRP